MQRTPEPELMTEAEQVKAYADADFEQPHRRFIELLREHLPRLPAAGTALDIGCGPGDITCRFAAAFSAWHVHGIDGSAPMLELAARARARSGLADRLSFHACYLPDGSAPLEQYELVVSNSLLHHLADPGALWQSIRRWSRPEGAVFVMDLMRPHSSSEAAALVDEYSRGEPEVLRRDFHNSLLAAYRPEEIRQQLIDAKLEHLRVQVVSDRHWLVVSP
jgi:2-polyprenyl-3-methyl-5-hydroxy-6-metoxy-1,4-benzoquinol methylase